MVSIVPATTVDTIPVPVPVAVAALVVAGEVVAGEFAQTPRAAYLSGVAHPGGHQVGCGL